MRKTFSVLTAALLLSTLPVSGDTKIVFLAGDDEYRSEESLPMLAKILERDFSFETVVGFSVDGEGFINPSEATSLTNTEQLADADLVVLYLRFRRPSAESFEPILKYFDSGKPLVAFRTSTHAFRFAHDSGLGQWGYQSNAEQVNSFGGGDALRDLLGQKWITHHGHFDDGLKPLTSVTLRETGAMHPVLRGVKPFEAYSWLYHVDGGEETLSGDPKILLDGRALQSNKLERKETDRFPLSNPVAWAKTDGVAGKERRVFTTTLGHPYDFRIPEMRRLALQGILWALGREEAIPGEGVNVETVEVYEPNNSGTGSGKFKTGLRPEDVTGRE